jgi:nitroimidazol reductase NimA-like FMN-containing flavoprotein (pyridoxamine 5'-phosphate oxidase superfamily)
MELSMQQELGVVGREIINANMYMVLGTADESGGPWVSPVYYAAAGFTEFYWVSSPDVRHSRNIAVRSRISIVIFNSQAVIGTGQAVYMSAVAEQLTGSDLDRGIEIFSRTSLGHGGHEWKREDVQAPALYRIYRAVVSEHWMLDPVNRPDHRVQVTL